MVLKTRSAKNKGARLQKLVRDTLRNIFYDKLEVADIESRQMGGTGTDIILSPAAKRLIKFDIECKNQEKINVWECLKQAENNTADDRMPALIFTRNRADVYITLKFEDFIKTTYGESK